VKGTASDRCRQKV